MHHFVKLGLVGMEEVTEVACYMFSQFGTNWVFGMIMLRSFTSLLVMFLPEQKCLFIQWPLVDLNEI